MIVTKKFKAKSETESMVFGDVLKFAELMEARWNAWCKRGYDKAGYTYMENGWEPSEGVKVIPASRKFHKITKYNLDGSDGESVKAFVCRETGTIYKPAGWAAPAKHGRGNVMEDAGSAALDNAGFVKYLA
jgi:hypothetical protein